MDDKKYKYEYAMFRGSKNAHEVLKFLSKRDGIRFHKLVDIAVQLLAEQRGVDFYKFMEAATHEA